MIYQMHPGHWGRGEWGTDDVMSPGEGHTLHTWCWFGFHRNPPQNYPLLCCSSLRDESGVEIPWFPSRVPFLASHPLMPAPFLEICCFFSSLQSALLQTTGLNCQRSVFFPPSFPLPCCNMIVYCCCCFCSFLRLKGLIFLYLLFLTKWSRFSLFCPPGFQFSLMIQSTKEG